MNKEKPNKYIKELEEETFHLKVCQKSKNIDSCLKCEKIIGCKIRNNYVKAVYNSMNKGQSGGFEF